MAVPTPCDNFEMFIGSTDGVPIGTMAACETKANASERPPTYCTAVRAERIGWHWPAPAGNGAGDGNRKYRSGTKKLIESYSCDRGIALRAFIV
jgi:hypothetical protein